jgi:hypothetical protein
MTGTGARAAGRIVRADFNYLGDPFNTSPSRRLHYYPDMGGSSNIAFAPSTMAIEDVRPIADAFTLDKQGFQLVHRPTDIPLADFADTARIGRAYLDECEALIRDLTGAASVMGVGPSCRFGDPTPSGDQAYDSRTVHWVHTDYSDESSHWLFDRFDVDLADYRRYAIYNVWRPLTPAPQDMPLALVDAWSVSRQDEEESVVIMKRPGERPQHTMTTVYHASAAHRWHFFSDMDPSEALVFVGYDSDPSRPHRVPHSAFIDPDCPSGTPPRSSVEARVMAVFDS